VKAHLKVEYTAAKLAARIAQMGRAISKDYEGKTLDVVIILENSFLFGADLVRKMTGNVVCHFVRAEMRDVVVGGFERKEIYYTPEPRLAGRDVLLVDAVLHSGVTLDFLVKRMTHTSHPRSLRVAVLFDRPGDRRVDLQPDYFGWQIASKYLVGYGLPGKDGLFRNLPHVAAVTDASTPRAHPGRSPRGGVQRRGRRAR